MTPEEKRKAYNKAWHEANKERVKERKKAYYEANKEHVKTHNKAWYEANKEKRKAYNKAFREANKEHVKTYNKAYYEANKENRKAYSKAWNETNKEHVKTYRKAYNETNKDWKAAHNAKRRASRLERTPPWLTEQHLKEMEGVYKLRQRLTEETGVVYHVDHIIPLQGKDISGLHVPWNLEVIPAEYNFSKCNSYEEERIVPKELRYG